MADRRVSPAPRVRARTRSSQASQPQRVRVRRAKSGRPVLILSRTGRPDTTKPRRVVVVGSPGRWHYCTPGCSCSDPWNVGEW